MKRLTAYSEYTGLVAKLLLNLHTTLSIFPLYLSMGKIIWLSSTERQNSKGQ